MAIKKLVLDDFLEEENFSLIGIHCTIEDYRLAYLLNKALELKLVRQDNDLDNNNNKTAFSIFEWEDDTQFKTWNLVSNTCKVVTSQTDNNLDSLFSFNPAVTKTHHLVPEFSKANYLLKIDNELHSKKEKLILEKILKIDQVITAYSIAPESLKSKDQLIFN
ncbi:IPExxxVDY family protein [Lacinutrix sp. Bg11-31]|uniref:IPExxxVDY family protein n=1 Tax=Lacinutrix sp. Bg11-31 TaxID=2057808 RepID=UPI000C30AC34|nr:IPExxxVDY family protein [Lacinutrix sp. Bg11-31]AUC82889.1 IPExxxVDY family protein [Lacinutrix sp. Bg11-31]